MNGADDRASGSRVDTVTIPTTGDVQHGDEPRPSGSSVALRFLVLYEDPYYLNVLGDMLEDCQFEVTRCSEFHIAVDMLQQNRDRFDILLSDVVVRGIDGFELLKRVSDDMDIPVIIMSGEDDMPVTIACIGHGCCRVLNGPIKRVVFRDIWQHIHGRGRCTSRDSALTRNPDINGNRQLQKPFEGSDHTSSESETKPKSSRNSDEKNNGGHEAAPPLKKKRVAWDGPLHQRFLWAANQLGGIDSREAVPTKILELMSVPGLTRHHVASHLQKHRQKELREKETRERNGKAHELPGDENSRNINMAGGPQQHPMIAGNGGQAIFPNGLPPRLPLLPPPPLSPSQLLPLPLPLPSLPLPPPLDFMISSRSLIQSEESSFGFNFSQLALEEWELGNIVGMEFGGFNPENTIPQHPHENIVSDAGTIFSTEGNVPFIDNLEQETNFSPDAEATGRHLDM